MARSSLYLLLIASCGPWFATTAVSKPSCVGMAEVAESVGSTSDRCRSDGSTTDRCRRPRAMAERWAGAELPRAPSRSAVRTSIWHDLSSTGWVMRASVMRAPGERIDSLKKTHWKDSYKLLLEDRISTAARIGVRPRSAREPAGGFGPKVHRLLSTRISGARLGGFLPLRLSPPVLHPARMRPATDCRAPRVFSHGGCSAAVPVAESPSVEPRSQRPSPCSPGCRLSGDRLVGAVVHGATPPANPVARRTA